MTLLSQTLPFLRTSEIRSVRAYTQFKEEQIRYLLLQRRRLYKSLGHESNAVRLMRYILQFVDHKYLEQKANNYQRYTDHLRFIRRDLMNTFDKVRSGKGFRNIFFEKSNFITDEYILPIEDVNTIINLPLYTEDWSVWKSVKPVYIWSHDSDEISLKLLNDRVGFSSLPPSYAVILLDVIALTFKYFIWNKYQRDKEPAENLAKEVPQQLFLHKYVMVDLLWDLLDIWLIRNLVKVTRCENIQEVESIFDSQALQGQQFYGRVGISSRKGYVDLWKTYTVSTMVPAIICGSELLSRGSITSRIIDLENRLMMPRNSAYEYLEWIRDQDILYFLVSLFNRRPALGESISFNRKMLSQTEQMIRRRPWNTCGNSLIKNEIESNMLKFRELLLEKNKFHK